MKKVMFKDERLQKQYEEEVDKLIHQYGFGCDNVLVKVKVVEDKNGKDNLKYTLYFTREGDTNGTLEYEEGVTVFYKSKYESLEEGPMSEFFDLRAFIDF